MRNVLLGTTTAILLATASAAALAQSSVSDDTDIVHSQMAAQGLESSAPTVIENWRARQRAGYEGGTPVMPGMTRNDPPLSKKYTVTDRDDIPAPAKQATRDWQALPNPADTVDPTPAPQPDTGEGDVALD